MCLLKRFCVKSMGIRTSLIGFRQTVYPSKHLTNLTSSPETEPLDVGLDRMGFELLEVQRMVVPGPEDSWENKCREEMSGLLP